MSFRLVFVHGWAFGPSFWDSLRAELVEYPSTALDLGYFGADSLGSRPAGYGPLVAVGHSLGVQWLLTDAPFSFDALVSLGGFGRFGSAPGPIRAMRRGLSRDAAAVVRAFHQACGYEGDWPSLESARPDRLAEGLDRLLTLDISEALPILSIPLLAVAAEDDAIVTPEQSREQFSTGLTMLPFGGHAFPVTRAAECATIIRAFLEKL